MPAKWPVPAYKDATMYTSLWETVALADTTAPNADIYAAVR